jgi:hypothetical protein
MNSRKPLITGLALLLACAAVQGEQADESDDERGRYAGVAGSENSVWVIDTRTGRARKCTQEFADQRPRCSDFSKQ